MGGWSLSITVSTTGFHPVNAGSTPAEITIEAFSGFEGAFLVTVIDENARQNGGAII